MNENTKRPKIKIPLSHFEIFTQILAAAALFIPVLILAASWSKLPHTIPSHFGFSGQPDAWSGKGSLLILPIITAALFGLLTLLERFPNIYNYPCEITAGNAEYMYRNARILMSCIKAEISLTFGFLNWRTVQVALGKSTGLGVGFLPIFLLVIFSTLIFFIYRMAKYNKAE